MPIAQSHLLYYAVWGAFVGGTYLATLVAGLTPVQLLQFNIAINLTMFGFILRNTAQISRLRGRSDADQD